ncbi:MAG: hypothetical protein ACI37Z_04205 [Candidatus Gastranaerophilaceae bacterium]
MKKFISIILTVLLMLQCNIIALAANTATVSADKVSLSQEEPTLIPVKIKNNNGIMGFKITVEYPVDKLDIKSVSRGEITAKGNFNTNFGINDGKFDVLWNNTDDVSGDGTLFVLSAQAATEISKDTAIKLSFSPPDTFNIKYEDVALDCQSIVISAKHIETTTENTTTQKGETTTKAATPIDSSQIIDAVDTTLAQNGCDNLNDVKDKDDFVKDFNKNLEIITGTNEHNVADFDTINSMYNSAYEGQFITEITNNIDSNVIDTVIKDTLKEFNAKSIDELDEKDKAKFVQRVEEKLKEQDTDIPSISEDLNTDDALDIIKKVYNQKNEDNEQQENEENSVQKGIIIAVSVVALIVLISIVIIIRKMRKTKSPN